jgi:hypothetical protein
MKSAWVSFGFLTSIPSDASVCNAASRPATLAMLFGVFAGHFRLTALTICSMTEGASWPASGAALAALAFS